MTEAALFGFNTMDLSEFRKSISAILHDRLTSPLFGSFFFSWIVWNWRIVFVMFFTNADELGVPKFIYIESELLNIWSGLVYPLISTIFILTAYSWISLKAYQLYLYFISRKYNYKVLSENNELLDVKRASELRLEMAKQQTAIEDTLLKKEEEINSLKSINQDLTKKYEEELVTLKKEFDEKASKIKDEVLSEFYEGQEEDQFPEEEIEILKREKPPLDFKLFTEGGEDTNRLSNAFSKLDMIGSAIRDEYRGILKQMQEDNMLESFYSIMEELNKKDKVEPAEEVDYLVQENLLRQIKGYPDSYDTSYLARALFKLLQLVSKRQ